MALGELGLHVQKDGTGCVSLTLHKDQLKMDERPYMALETPKLLETNAKETLQEKKSLKWTLVRRK